MTRTVPIALLGLILGGSALGQQPVIDDRVHEPALPQYQGGEEREREAKQAAAQRQAPRVNARKPAAGKKKPAAESQPEVPPPPPTPAQMPPNAPQVSYQGGQLSIVTQNSTLADVLAAVRRQTGATVEVPGMASSERVFGKFGPGSPHDVLADLLDGSKFDFIVLAAPERPEAIQYVKLTPKRGGPPTPPPAMAAGRPAPQPDPRGVEESFEEEIPPDEGVVEEPAQMEPQQPAEGQPGQPQPGQPQQVQPGQEGVKSPEQLLQELQRLQQQQQEQIQQQLNPANRIPPQNPNDPNNPNRNPPDQQQPEPE